MAEYLILEQLQGIAYHLIEKLPCQTRARLADTSDQMPETFARRRPRNKVLSFTMNGQISNIYPITQPISTSISLSTCH